MLQKKLVGNVYRLLYNNCDIHPSSKNDCSLRRILKTQSLIFLCRISSNTLIRDYNGLYLSRWLLARREGHRSRNSTALIALPRVLGPQPLLAVLPPPSPHRRKFVLNFTTRPVAQQQPPRNGGKLLAVTWRLDDWRLAPCRRVRRSPRPPPSLPPLSLSVCRLPPPPPPPLLPSQSPLSLLRLSSRSFIYLFFHVRTRTRVLTRYVPSRTHVPPLSCISMLHHHGFGDDIGDPYSRRHRGAPSISIGVPAILPPSPPSASSSSQISVFELGIRMWLGTYQNGELARFDVNRISPTTPDDVFAKCK